MSVAQRLCIRQAWSSAVSFSSHREARTEAQRPQQLAPSPVAGEQAGTGSELGSSDLRTCALGSPP